MGKKGGRTVKSMDKRNMAATVILVVAAGFLVYGVLRGETETVLGKAITVCLQCIGIG